MMRTRLNEYTGLNKYYVGFTGYMMVKAADEDEARREAENILGELTEILDPLEVRDLEIETIEEE